MKVLLRTEGGETPAWLMAALIYGGGWRVTECCHLRMTDLDFDQGLVLIRSGKGDKSRSTLLAEVDWEKLRAHLQRVEADAGAVIRRPPQGGSRALQSTRPSMPRPGGVGQRALHNDGAAAGLTLRDQACDVSGQNRSTNIVPLHSLAASLAPELELFLGRDPVGDDPEAKIVRHPNDGRHDG